ncbi:MAG: 4-(cytidine 5'-diphospho)-2-C-methyl-D-erythritol kinase [Neomegalonema sp.]|nr:4-(cytidine 5'-diphospho)-2-C-methyl-D-erythritol kinase [Neomegalonema sp.]
MAADAADQLWEIAPAKVNLWLHVVGRREDGYHLLDSLTVFPDVGDLIEAEPSPFLSLTVDGPFAQELGAGLDNLVLRAADGLAKLNAEKQGASAPGAALRLEKRLPVASGVGGGSADAAAALKVLMRLWRRPVDIAALHKLALSLGADVPACLLGPGPVMLRGIGDEVAAAPPVPSFAVLLVNPGAPVSTPKVFAALERRDNPAPPAFTGAASLDELVGFLAQTRNDLEAPARTLAPRIGEALDALNMAAGCHFARMSGSGATCFGLFKTEGAAAQALLSIKAQHPNFWCAVGRVGSSGDLKLDGPI